MQKRKQSLSLIMCGLMLLSVATGCGSRTGEETRQSGMDPLGVGSAESQTETAAETKAAMMAPAVARTGVLEPLLTPIHWKTRRPKNILLIISIMRARAVSLPSKMRRSTQRPAYTRMKRHGKRPLQRIMLFVAWGLTQMACIACM